MGAAIRSENRGRAGRGKSGDDGLGGAGPWAWAWVKAKVSVVYLVCRPPKEFPLHSRMPEQLCLMSPLSDPHYRLLVELQRLVGFGKGRFRDLADPIHRISNPAGKSRH